MFRCLRVKIPFTKSNSTISSSSSGMWSGMDEYSKYADTFALDGKRIMSMKAEKFKFIVAGLTTTRSGKGSCLATKSGTWKDLKFEKRSARSQPSKTPSEVILMWISFRPNFDSRKAFVHFFRAGQFWRAPLDEKLGRTRWITAPRCHLNWGDHSHSKLFYPV